MADIEVHIDFSPGLKRVGTLHRHARRGGEAISFEYHADWLADPARFSLEPALALGRGAFVPADQQLIFGSIGDSAPDTWGRRLMQRAERRRAERDGRAPHTLQELDYLLGVSDVSRLGALRFRNVGEEPFRSPAAGGVPKLVDLGRLLGVTERILREQETDEDLQMIFAPGSSLGEHGRKRQSLISTADFPSPNFQRKSTNTASSCGSSLRLLSQSKPASERLLMSYSALPEGPCCSRAASIVPMAHASRFYLDSQCSPSRMESAPATRN